MNEQQLEQKLQDKGLNAPRLTPDLIDATIKSKEFYAFPASCLTVCCITLRNGYTVEGASACASPENFDKETGEQIAFQNARDKIWELEGYLLKQRLFEATKTTPSPLARVVIEKHELEEKLVSLDQFIDKGKPTSITTNNWALLLEQQQLMSLYFGVLELRIENW